MKTRATTALRRFRTYSRRTVATVSGRPASCCFYMHIPKCGGTSISEALSATVPLGRKIGVVDANATRRASAILIDGQDRNDLQFDDFENSKNVYELRRKLVVTYMCQGVQLVFGHVLFDELYRRHFGSSYKFVTLLRDPVTRTISNFLHTSRDGFIPRDFDNYLEGAVVRAHGLTFLRFFSGTPVIPSGAEKKALDQAKENMKAFSIIGFLDDLEKFKREYRHVFGSNLGIYSYNERGRDDFRPSSAQMEKLMTIMEPELELWEYANETFR